MPTMKPMLAGKFPGDDQLTFPLYVQPKLDGIRAMVVDGKLVSRTLKPIPNAYIRSILEKPEFEGLDGELIVGAPTDKNCYRNTVSGVMSEDGEPEFTYFVFDLWNHQGTFKQRYAELDMACLPDEYISVVETGLATDLALLKAAEEMYVNMGLEGCILRGPDTRYKFGRGTASKGDLLKLKRFTDSEAVVIGIYEEEHNANEATTNALGRTERSSHQANKIGKGTLGGLIVSLIADHAGFAAGTEFRIGTGFDAAERKALWEERDSIPGRIAKFKHFEVGAKDKPRHPVFLGWRDERDMS